MVEAEQFADEIKGQEDRVSMMVLRVGECDDPASRVRVANLEVVQVPDIVSDLLTRYDDVFKMPEHPEPVAGVEHAIETTQDPPFGRIYNMSATELAALKEYLAVALDRGWITHSTSSAGSPILFVPKKDGGLRMCVDYRALNAVTVKNRMALPLISEILDRVAGARYFSKIDLEAAFHRMSIRQQDRWKTAFRTRYGHFEYKVMPFGLTNAPATFQAYINQVLHELVDVCCVVYLDDILIFSKTEEEHAEHIEAVLRKLRAGALYASPKKCAFFVKEVEYLGFLIGENGVRMDPQRVAAIADWPAPRNFKEVQIFLGFVNFYRRFIAGFSHIARPLSGLLKGSKDGKTFGTWKWGPDQETAFRWLRECFTQAPLLRHFEPGHPLLMETDASAFAVAAVLSQLKEDGQWYPISFWSRKLIAAETNYKVYDQELLAIVKAFAHWRPYLAGAAHPTRVLTDHANLRGFLKAQKLSTRQVGWLEELAEYDFVIHYRQGKQNPADGPSRRPDYQWTKEELEANRNSHLPTLLQKLGLLRTDLGDQEIRQWVATNSHASSLSLPKPAKRISVQAAERFEACLPQADPQQGALDTHAGPEVGISAVQCIPFEVARIAAKRVDPVHGDTDNENGTMVSLIADLQRTDAFTQAKRMQVDQNPKGPWSKEGEDELLYFRERLYVPKEGESMRKALYVPGDKSLRRALIERFHDAPLAGHFGRQRTLELIQRHFHWEGIEKDVREYTVRCKQCQWTHAKRHRPYGKLQSLETPTEPWTHLSMDFVTDLPPSKGRMRIAYDAILVITDRLTKYAMYTPTMKTAKADELADIMVERIIPFAGVPQSIVSDRGPQFTSLLWQEFCVAL